MEHKKAETKEQVFGYASKTNEYGDDQMLGTSEQIKKFLKRRRVGYEFFKGPVIPFFDIDKYYKTQQEQEDDWEPLLNMCYEKLDKEYADYPQRHIYVLDSSGYKEHKKGNWINSFHFKIRGVGYFNCGNGVRPVAERLGFKVDMIVYKQEDAWVKFRLPYATKDIEHPRFARIVKRGKDGEWFELELEKAEEQIVRGKQDCYANWLIQNVEGEKCLDGEPKAEVKHEVVKRKEVKHEVEVNCGMETSKESIEAMEAYHIPGVFEEASVKEIPAKVYEWPHERLRTLVMLLDKKRAEDYEWWFDVCCAIQHTAETNGNYDALDIADEFSQKANYGGKNVVKDKYENARRTRKTKDKVLTYKTLCMWAKEDNPEGFAQLIRREIKQSVYGDSKNILKKGEALTRQEVEEWMLGCIIQKDDGETTLFTRASKYQWKAHADLFVGNSDYFIYEKRESDTKTKKEKIVKVYFREIFKNVKQSPEFLDNNRFDEVGFFPYFTPEQKKYVDAMITEKYVEEGKTYFNKFGQLPITQEPITDRLQIVLKHIRNVLCNNHEGFYEYVLNWMAKRVQRPWDKVEKCLIFISGQGAGKGIFWEWFRKQFWGEQYGHNINNIERLFQDFNSLMEDKLFTILDEIGLYGMDKRKAAQLKNIITGVRQEINKKHVNQYNVNDFNAFVILTNNDWPVIIESDDRRYPTIRSNDEYIGNRQYFLKLGKELDASMARQFFKFLIDRDISEWDPNKIPMTESRREMKELSLEKPIKFMIAIADGRFDEDDYAKLKLDSFQEDSWRFQVKELYNHYKAWLTDVGQSKYAESEDIFKLHLKKMGLPTTTVRIKVNDRTLPPCKGYKFTIKELQELLRKYMHDDEYQFQSREEEEKQVR